MQAMLGGISSLAVYWAVVRLGCDRSLALHAEYQAFLKASTKDKDSDPNLRICVNVKAPDVPQKKGGPTVGSTQQHQQLVALCSILKGICSDATHLQGFCILTERGKLFLLCLLQHSRSCSSRHRLFAV
jgi:hypothetical protein